MFRVADMMETLRSFRLAIGALRRPRTTSVALVLDSLSEDAVGAVLYHHGLVLVDTANPARGVAISRPHCTPCSLATRMARLAADDVAAALEGHAM